MDALEITYRLRRKGLTQADVARDLEMLRQTVNCVIHRRQKSRRIESHIALLLGISKDILFPDRYPIAA